MEQTLSADGGPSTDELDYAQWAHQYDDGSPSFITDQSTSTLSSIEAAEAAFLMFQTGDDGTYAEGPSIEEYEWNSCGESGIGDNFNLNPFQRNDYDGNEWNDNLLEDREEDFDGSSLLGSPHEEQTSDTFDVTTKGDDVVNSLALLTKSVAKKSKVTKRKAKASRRKQRMMDNRLDSLEKQMTMVMQSLKNQAISMADQRQTMVESGEKWEENWQKSEQKHGKHEDSLKVSFRLLNLQTRTMAQLNSAKLAMENKT